MLKFYYHPLSPIARRVWLALLEKEVPFEPILVNLKDRENLQPHYLTINPFHHVPTVVDGKVRILESLAILDYLEAQYPKVPLSSDKPAAIAKMKMVQLVAANELMPQLPHLVFLEESASPDAVVLQKMDKILTFLTEQLGDTPFFGGDCLSLADVTVGATLPLTARLGFSLTNYSAVARWCDRINNREAWQQTEPDAESLFAWKRWITLMVKRKVRYRSKS